MQEEKRIPEKKEIQEKKERINRDKSNMKITSISLLTFFMFLFMFIFYVSIKLKSANLLVFRRRKPKIESFLD